MEQSRGKVYWLEDPIWYTPHSVIYHYAAHLDSLPIKQKEGKVFRKADELVVAAHALLGIQIKEGDHWMQLVSDSESSPDVRTGHFLPSDGIHAPHWEYQDIEVVSFVPTPGEDVGAFLTRTKLSKAKAYDDKTIVLLHVQTGTQIKSWEDIATALKATGAVCPVIGLGRTDPVRKDYVLFQLHPRIAALAKYNLDDILKTQSRRSVLNLRRGSKPSNESRPNEEHCPFESLGFQCSLLKTST
jgi:hypothetical protein